MSKTKNEITEEDYLIDLQSVLDIVDLPEDAVETLIARGHFPKPKYDGLWFGPEVFEWQCYSDGPPGEHSQGRCEGGTTCRFASDVTSDLSEDHHF